MKKIIFKKIDAWILYLTIVLSIVFAIIFGALVRQELVSSLTFGPISKTALFLSEIPKNLAHIYYNIKDKGFDNNVKNSPYLKKPRFKRFIQTNRDELLLMARYDGNLKRSVVELVDLNDFSVFHTFKPNIDEFNDKADTSKEEFKNLLRDVSAKRARIWHPLLTSEGELLFNLMQLVKIDFCGNLLWTNDEDVFHHSINIDHEGNYWVPSRIFPFSLDKKLIGDKIDNYFDDAITKISKDGKILYQKSVSEILIENNHKSLIFGTNYVFSIDPIHLNDIQPAMNDSLFWNKGDLFLSLRHMSLILHFRPQTNQLINVIRGPFFHQHDVDIISEKEISIFNNNSFNSHFDEIILSNNEVVVYNFETKQFYQKFAESMKKHSLKTVKNGLSEILNDGSMIVEETDYGRILFFNKDGELEWEFINKADNDKTYLVNWIRVIKNKPLIERIKQKIQNTKCTN
jgi:hypothetical protein